MKNPQELKIEILAVGSELLTPFFQDTNSLFLSQRLNDLGMNVSYKSIVGDEWDDLVCSIQAAISRADIIFSIGGLGPTQDDRTREAFAAVLEKKLVYKDELLKKIEKRFKRRGLSMPAVNKRQAYILEGSEILDNSKGTAPGLWVEEGSKIVVLLPGPPHEIKPMFESYVWPRMQKFRLKHTSRRILKITGLTESKIESLIRGLYSKESDLQLTTLACPGQIEIHLTSFSGKDKEKADRRIRQLENSILERLGDHVFSTTGEELEEVVGKFLTTQKKTLAVAESCSGGLLGNRITNVPGSSRYFIQGVITYSNDAKCSLLGVSPRLIQSHGAVSSEVAQAMAVAVRKKAKSDYGLAITGITGPEGGTVDKPVGLVYIAISWDSGFSVTENLFLGQRNLIKFQSSQRALDMLRNQLIENTKAK